MPIKAFLAPPRPAAALITALVVLTGALAGTAQADPTTFCNPGVTTTFKGGGNWGDGDNWSNGQPTAFCDAVIPANTTVTFSTTVDHYGNESGSAMKGLTIGAGSTLIVEGEFSTVQGNGSNATSIFVGADGMTIAKGATVDLDATGNNDPAFTPSENEPSGGSANLTVDSSSTTPAPLVNDGTINAISTDPTWGDSLNVGGTVTNAGTINDQSGKLTFQGQGNLPYIFDNTGSFSISSNAAFTMLAGDGSLFSNTGTFANQGTATLQQTMHWVQNGGSETGNPVDLTGPEVLEDTSGAGSFEVTNCTVAGLTGTIPSNQTITVQGQCSGTTLNLGDAADTATVVNHGTLDLVAPVGGSDGILQGSELENYGTVNSTVGGPLPLANQLLDPLVNEKGGIVNLAGGELAQTSGSTTTNEGTVNIAAGSTWLVQGGDFTNKGTLAPKIAGAKSLGTVNLTAEGKFTAGGTVAVALASGYKPKTGAEFPFVTYNGGSASGKFGSVRGGFAPDYKKETASPAYIGLIYGTVTTPKVSLKVTCHAAAKQCKSYSAKAKKLKVLVDIKAGGKLIAKKTLTITEPKKK